MATIPADKKPVTILGGKYELIGVQRESSLILKGREVRWDYLTKEQAADLVLDNSPYIKSVKPGKVEEQIQETQEPPK